MRISDWSSDVCSSDLPSGDRLREWMGFSKEEFYDASKVAILPIGLCYPGRAGSGGDAPPRPECATLWRERLLGQMPALKITLLVGSYAQKNALGSGAMTRSEEHTSELQSLMRISYAVF